METYPGNEEEQKQETPQRKGGKEGKTREGGEDSKAVKGVVKKERKKILCIFICELKTIIDSKSVLIGHGRLTLKYTSQEFKIKVLISPRDFKSNWGVNM